nr:hypothetical protein [Tanacetum cinerariifolium]
MWLKYHINLKQALEQPLTHEQPKIINATIGDDQINSDIIFDDPNVKVNSGSVEHNKNAHDSHDNKLEQLARNAYKEAEKQQIIANKTRIQTNGEINELIENVNQKTYAYGDVRAKNQDLLITISELKAKLKNVEKVGMFVAYAAYKNFTIFQIDVKTTFLNRPLKEEAYKHRMDECDSMSTPMATARLDADLQGTLTDHKKYHSMIRGLMYLTASRPDITFATFVCAKNAGFHDYCKSTSGGLQFLSEKRVMWSSKKKDCTAMYTAEDKYVSLSTCCAQVIWMQTQLLDYGYKFNKILMYCDSKSDIAIFCNLV